MSRRGSKSLTLIGNWVSLALVLGAIGSAAVVYWRWQYREQRFNQLIEEIATQNGVDKFLVKAVIRRESKFDPYAYGSHGEIGLMQVTERAGWDWARAVGRRNFGRDALWDPQINIEAGSWYLARALSRWPDKEPEERLAFALAEYNSGMGNVLRWLPNGRQTTTAEFIDAISNPAVRQYVSEVLENYKVYKERGRL
ncbi:MAG TPA: lytic transglycosylase domain-containing protein [Verrucomicrobiae bacterium]|nr:lytic transglycosylase domain-containing protein [Verrucomicrobiae bacterium]